MTTYKPDERDKAQAVINFFVFGTMAFTSLASGAMITGQGWDILNLSSIIPVSITGAALVWLSLHKRKNNIANQSIKTF